MRKNNVWGGQVLAIQKITKIQKMLNAGLDFGESSVPVWTKETRALFASRLRYAHVTTSYAVARCVANALIYGSHDIPPCARLSANFITVAPPARLISAFIQRSAAGLA